MIDSESYQPSKEVIASDKSTEIDKSLEIVFQNQAFEYSLGLKEALDLSPSTNASDDIQLLSLPEANDGHIMIRGGSGAGGFKIQKTLAFSDAKRSIKTKSDKTTSYDIKELYLYDILFLTGMGISTWLLRNILKN